MGYRILIQGKGGIWNKVGRYYCSRILDSLSLNISYPRISVLPEVEEFLVVFDGFTFPALLLVQLGQPVMINRMVWRFRLICYSFCVLVLVVSCVILSFQVASGRKL